MNFFHTLFCSEYVKQSNTFKKLMADQIFFTIKQIVWAKVSDYPWWPARIVKTLTQRCRNIYKVHFFGDLSYCYLQSQQLLDFESGFSRLQEKHSSDLILKKSIQLAKAAFQKSKTKAYLLENHDQYLTEVQPPNVDCFQQTKLQPKPTIQLTVKSKQILQVNYEDKKIKAQLCQQLADINTENVMEFICSPSFRELKNSKGYNNRKQVLTLQLKFKEVLLAKYNLSHIPKRHVEQKRPKPHFHGRSNLRKNIERSDKRYLLKNKDVLRSAARTLQKMMKNILGVSNQQAIFQVQKYFRYNHHMAQKNKKQFGRSYVNYVKYMIKNKRLPDLQQKWPNNITTFVQNQKQAQKEADKQTKQEILKEYQFLQQAVSNLNVSAMQLQDDLRKEDEERSKVTQIQGYSYTH